MEPPDRQILNLRLTPFESQSRGQHGRNAVSVMPSEPITLDPQTARENVQIEGKEAERFIYPVGSYGKIFIALTWILLLKDPTFRRTHDVTSETSACDLYNEKRDKRKSPEMRIPGDPSILDLVNHVNGFPGMNKYLIAPDGKPLLSETEEFLRAADQIGKDEYKDRKESTFEYSNANYSFLGILLELLTGKELWLLVKEMVFDKLGMTDTTFGVEYPKERERVFVDGVRVSANGIRSTVNGFSHLNSIVQYAPLGLRSSQRDLAIFNHEILLGLDGVSRLGLSEDDVQKLFYGEPMAPFGHFIQLGQQTYSESPNTYLLPEQYRPYQLGKPKIQDGGMALAFRKAGYVDGFGCNVIFMPSRRVSIVVLGNTTGPIDTTLHVSNLVLQEALRLTPSVNIVERTIDEGKQCCAKLSQIENPEELTQVSPRPAGDLAGAYEHERYEQRITVYENGTAELSTRTNISSKMNLIHIGPNLVMLRPGEQGFSFETWSAWSNMKFEVRRSQDGLGLVVALAQPAEKYAYKKCV